jgi:hypothetical protein
MRGPPCRRRGSVRLLWTDDMEKGWRGERTFEIYVRGPVAIDVWDLTFSAAVERGVVAGAEAGIGGVEGVEGWWERG